MLTLMTAMAITMLMAAMVMMMAVTRTSVCIRIIIVEDVAGGMGEYDDDSDCADGRYHP